MPSNKFADANRASEILQKIGKGAVDADFARTVHDAIDAAQTTNKKAVVMVKVEIEPDEDKGCLMIRAGVTAKLPKLPLPASQMHVGAGGALLTQQEWMFSGKDEAKADPAPIEPATQPTSPSGRFPVAKAPALAPIASAPAPHPVATKDDTEKE